MDAVEKRARELLASCLDEWGHPCEAENVREGEDLDSYESELRLISQLLCFGMDTAESHGRAALTPPEGYVLVPVEPTEAMLQAQGRVVFREAGQQWDSASGYPEQFVIDVQRQCHAAMLAARPEVKP